MSKDKKVIRTTKGPITAVSRHSGEVLKDPNLFDFLGLGDASVGPVMQSKNRQRDPNHSGRAEEPLTRSLGLKLT